MNPLVLDRRSLLAIGVLLASGESFRIAPAAASEATVSPGASSFDALAAYCGVYRIRRGHTIGVDRFVNDAGEGVLLWADHSSGVVRQMFAGSSGTHTVGAAFGQREPVELTVLFMRNPAGQIVSLSVRDRSGAEVSAARQGSREESVAFVNGDAALKGTLILPEGAGPHPAVVLLHGSGPLTRYSFGPYPRFFNALGLAVLHFDKRGTGASSGWRVDASTGAPDRLTPSFYPDDLLGDAAAAFDLLRARSDIDPHRIGFWGSSEGGMLATQVAARNPTTAFAINSSGFMGPLWQTLLYQADIDLRVQNVPENDIAQAVAFNHLALDVARTGQGYEQFLKRRQDLISSGRQSWIAWYVGDYSSLEQMRWSWDHILSFDPVPALRNVACPALGVFGEFDRATDAPKASIAMREGISLGGNRDVTVRVIPKASHSLTEQSSWTAPQGARMAPGSFELLREWIGARVA